LTRPLGRRQLAALEMLKRGPLSADELGRRLHAAAGAHPPDVDFACEWCIRTGIAVATSLVRRDLVRVLDIRIQLRDDVETTPSSPRTGGSHSEIDVDAELARLRRRVAEWDAEG